MRNVSRRGFIGTAALGTIGLAGASLLSACSPSKGQSDLPSTSTDGKSSELMTTDQYVDTPWSFEIPPDPIAEEDITETKEADIVVVGAGTSGLCCALSAAQNGVDVQVIAQSDAPVARGGSNSAVYSKYMKEVGVPKWDADQDLRSHLLHSSFNVDTRKWYKFYNHSEEAMNWLIDEMAAENDGWHVEIESASWGMPPNDPMRMLAGTHGWTNGEAPGPMGQPHVVEVLASHILSEGGRIDYSTTAEQLVREGGTGRVNAVIAKDASGRYIKYAARKAVVLATGDFSADKEMVAKDAPLGLEMFTNWDQATSPDSTNLVWGGLYKGTGHKMGLWVGAAWQKTYPCPVMFSGAPDQGVGKPCVMLDETGHRFWAEERTEGILGQVQRHCPHETYFNIWGSNFADDFPYFFSSYGAEPTPADDLKAEWESAAEAGSIVKADSLKELVDKLGLPDDAVEEIERYNRFCENGLDEDFHKMKEYLAPVSKAPFYGKKVDSYGVLTVIGGLRTNANMQVCDEEDAAIPGLYNVGTMVGDSMSNAYTFQIPGFNLGMNCVCFGYLTGKYIAENE